MNLRQISYFVAVADMGSMTAAAERLNVSQPALSARLRELELRNSVTLFARHPRGIMLTEEGRRFLPAAREVLAAVDRARTALQPILVPLDVVRLGVTPSLGVTLLPRLLEKSDEAFAGRLAVNQGPADMLFRSLAEYELDSVLCYGRVPASAGRILPKFVEDLWLIGPSGVVGNDKVAVALQELRDIPLVLDPPSHPVRRQIDEALSRKDLTLTIVEEVQPTSGKLGQMRRRSAATIGPRWLFEQEVTQGEFVARPVRAPRLELTLSLVISHSMPAELAGSFEHLIDLTIASLLPEQPSWLPVSDGISALGLQTD